MVATSEPTSTEIKRDLRRLVTPAVFLEYFGRVGSRIAGRCAGAKTRLIASSTSPVRPDGRRAPGLGPLRPTRWVTQHTRDRTTAVSPRPMEELTAVQSPHISHWDVPDMTEVLREAFELVERPAAHGGGLPRLHLHKCGPPPRRREPGLRQGNGSQNSRRAWAVSGLGPVNSTAWRRKLRTCHSDPDLSFRTQ